MHSYLGMVSRYNQHLSLTLGNLSRMTITRIFWKSFKNAFKISPHFVFSKKDVKWKPKNITPSPKLTLSSWILPFGNIESWGCEFTAEMRKYKYNLYSHFFPILLTILCDQSCTPSKILELVKFVQGWGRRHQHTKRQKREYWGWGKGRGWGRGHQHIKGQKRASHRCVNTNSIWAPTFSYNPINHTCTVIESCTWSKTLELVESVICNVIHGTYSTNSWILDPVHVLQYRVHSTYSTNSKVLDRVHDSITVRCA